MENAPRRPPADNINNKLPSLISLSRDPIFGVQDERKLSTMNNKALNYKRSPLRRSGKRGAANCKARIFPYRPKKMPTLTHFSCFRVRLQKQKDVFASPKLHLWRVSRAPLLRLSGMHRSAKRAFLLVLSHVGNARRKSQHYKL